MVASERVELRLILAMAPSYQGGHSKIGSEVAEYLDVPFPLRVSDLEKKAKGIIPKSAKIGSGIAIHGTWPHEEFAVEYLQNWTLGCISMRNDHLDELYGMINIGTKVIIRK